MTRFARAFGSKSSNARVPEEATSWYVMKQQIEKNKVKHQNRKDADNTSSLEISKPVVRKNCSKVWEKFDDSTSRLEISKPTVEKNCSKVWENFDDIIEEDLSNSKNHTSKASENRSINKQVKKNCKVDLAKETERVNSVSHETTNFLKSSGNLFAVSCKERKKQKDVEEISKDKGIFLKNYKQDDESINAPVFTCNNVQSALEENKVTNKKRKHFSEISVSEDELDVKFDNSRREFNKEYDNFSSEKGNKKIKFASSESKFLKEFDNFSTEIIDKKEKLNNSKNQNIESKYYNSKQCKLNNKNFMNNVSYFQGFAVKEEDAKRLHKLKKDLLAKGVPRKTVLDTLNAERRKAEKALARAKKVICYNCRQFGHSMSDCPEMEDSSGICFKCGSTEHTSKTCRVVQGDSFKFSRCFICQEQGHISRQCPDNPRGLYPKGGCCKICGDVTHLRSDCPSLVSEKEKSRVTVGTVDDECIEGLDQEFEKTKKNSFVKKRRVVKF